jgi:hypothetical protein
MKMGVESARGSVDSVPGSQKELEPAKVLMAQRIAKDVVDCDSGILSLIIVDEMGRVLHVARSGRLPISEQVSAQSLPVFGAIAKMLVGAANNASPFMGTTEAVIGVFKNQKVLVLNLQQYNVTLGLRLSRSASAEYISEKVRDLLAAGAEG